MAANITAFDLAAELDQRAFRTHEHVYLDVIEAAYGADAHPRDFHIDRIRRQQHLILFHHAEDERVTGVASVRPDGKLCALGVAPDSRSRGHARGLVLFAAAQRRHLYCEVKFTNVQMRAFASHVGFEYLRDESRILSLLGADAALVSGWIRTHDCLSYERASRSFAGRPSQLVMLELRQQPQVGGLQM